VNRDKSSKPIFAPISRFNYIPGGTSVDSPEEKMRRRWLAAPFAIINGSAFARIVKPADKEEALAQNRRVCQSQSQSQPARSVRYWSSKHIFATSFAGKGREEEEEEEEAASDLKSNMGPRETRQIELE
jgi:hypothetical protein